MEIALEEEEQSSPKLHAFIRVILTRLVSSSLPMHYPFKQHIFKNDWRIVNLQCSTSFRCTAKCFSYSYQSVQSFSRVRFFVTPWTAAHQASLSITNSMDSNSCPSSWWSHPTVSSSVVPFSSCLQSFPISSSHQVAKVLEFQLQHQSFQWIFRTDFL